MRVAADPGAPDDVVRMFRDRPDLFGVSERAIRAVIDHVKRAGGAGSWLLSQGLEDARLDALRRCLVAAS